jgi:DNA primase
MANRSITCPQDTVLAKDRTPTVIYRLPDVIAAMRDPNNQGRIYVAEGEKDADRFWAEGIPATTNAMGAAKWTAEYTNQLRDAEVKFVVILPDNDDPGRRHADVVASSCAVGGMRVRIVELPDPAPKGDVSDWLNANGSAKDLQRLVDAAAPNAPGALGS